MTSSFFWPYEHSVLGDVEEVGSLVSQHSDLSIVLAFDPVIALAFSSLLVLGFEKEVCHQASAEQEEGQVCQHYSVTKVVLWLVLCSVVRFEVSDAELERWLRVAEAYL